MGETPTWFVKRRGTPEWTVGELASNPRGFLVADASEVYVSI